MFNDFSNDQDFSKLTGGLDKGGTGQRAGDWTTSNTVSQNESAQDTTDLFIYFKGNNPNEIHYATIFYTRRFFIRKII